ncbi:MAG: adenine phosphoribosyltransferase [Propionibacteriaceae bacterium]|nr:adenine phosphoribosyltransferase [Propionibacteriaceae bacterium]
MADNVDKIGKFVRNIPDFPKPGIQFKDITPLLASPSGFKLALDAMMAQVPDDIGVVAGVESRGFIFGVPLAMALGVGFVPVRKPGKLPGPTYEESFDLEYGSSVLSIHQDALKPGQKVLLVDDLLASGGTLIAAANLVRRANAVPAHVSVLLELSAQGGRAQLAKAGLTSVSSVLAY